MSDDHHVGGTDFPRKSKKRKRFVDDEDMEKLNGMLKELLNVESGLRAKEIDFLDDLKDNWKGNFTTGQASWLTTIYIWVMK
ncbi:MAG: hypothetical protein FVQ80_11565 [Planctomycetes bacterium]|nr:hypothetical protein [Planctomycetota bacterium]